MHHMKKGRPTPKGGTTVATVKSTHGRRHVLPARSRTLRLSPSLVLIGALHDLDRAAQERLEATNREAVAASAVAESNVTGAHR